MGWARGIVTAAVIAVSGAAVPIAAMSVAAGPPLGDTADLLDDAATALTSGDLTEFDQLADELRDDHWLPDGGWDALDDQDALTLAFLSDLLDSTEFDLIRAAFEVVSVERELIAIAQEMGAGQADPFLLDELAFVDSDGAMILEVINARAIGVSPDARLVLEEMNDESDVFDAALEDYDAVLEAMANRLAGDPPSDFASPEVVLGEPPLSGTPPPPLDADRPEPVGEPPAEGVGPGQLDGTADEPAATETDTPAPSAATATPHGTSDVAAATGTNDTTDEVSSAALPSPASPAGPGDPMNRPGGGLHPVALGIGLAAAAALGVALVAIRRSHRRQHGLVTAAYTDSLTGLHNRRRFDDDLADQTRHGDRPTSVLMIDVDHFKRFNDTHGHAVGDDVLRRVSSLISDTVRTSDLPYRYGGEEFSVLLPDTRATDAAVVGERVRRAIESEQLSARDGTPVSITASVGLSSGDASDVVELVHQADLALYSAKEQGRNRLVQA